RNRAIVQQLINIYAVIAIAPNIKHRKIKTMQLHKSFSSIRAMRRAAWLWRFLGFFLFIFSSFYLFIPSSLHPVIP
ncbi:MAG: hypothetical protein LBT59_10325, partial [Clostridiales bacterium]|nr:hypothetical protein [Clostridiales bacterium]